MNIESRVSTFYKPAKKYPLNPILADATPQFRNFVKTTAQMMLLKAKNNLAPGEQSNNPRRKRKLKDIKRTGSYMANNTFLWVSTSSKVAPQFVISNESSYGAAYEASHGILLRTLLESASSK